MNTANTFTYCLRQSPSRKLLSTLDAKKRPQRWLGENADALRGFGFLGIPSVIFWLAWLRAFGSRALRLGQTRFASRGDVVKAG